MPSGPYENSIGQHGNSNDEEVKRLAVAGKMMLAINMYRQLHNVGVARAKDAVEELAGRPHSVPKISRLVLSPETQRRLEILFREGNRDAAAKLLIEECGTNLPLCEKSNEFDMERIRFAAIKLSGGDFLDLREAVELAKLDWRDLLCTAGFGSDVKAHEKWLAP